MSKRRKFSVEFKRGALEQANQPGVSCVQVARELGIRDNLLTRWKREPGARVAAPLLWFLQTVTASATLNRLLQSPSDAHRVLIICVPFESKSIATSVPAV
jgi:transposase-like protein